MSIKRKIFAWCAVGVVINFIVGALLTMQVNAGQFDGQYFVTFDGEIRLNGVVVEEYKTDDNFTVKGTGLYYGLTTDKDSRVGRIRYTSKNKATIVISYYGQGKITIVMRRDGTGWKGKGHGWYIGEDELRYTLRETVHAELVSQ